MSFNSFVLTKRPSRHAPWLGQKKFRRVYVLLGGSKHLLTKTTEVGYFPTDLLTELTNSQMFNDFNVFFLLVLHTDRLSS